MTIKISDSNKIVAFYEVPKKVANAITVLLKECECDSEIISAEEEGEQT